MESQTYKLRMIKGQENGVVISKDVSEKSDYMYNTYKRAGEAVKEIIIRAARTREAAKSNTESALYQYSQNIIAFSGSRGQGKTSAMLSFSNMLQEHDSAVRAKFGLEKYSFTVLPPIDPTILGENQDMLTIVLSRLYRETQRLYIQQEQSRYPQFTELEKNELLGMIQRCLSHIGSLSKGFQYEGGQGMVQLREIADSNDLKCEFFELVDRILRLEKDTASLPNRRFLVLQLDDTDFQVARGYEILEDIRKYLTIPNVIILMATDMDLLRREVTQSYLKDFSVSLCHKQIQPNTIQQIGAKYTAKIIPPMYTAYMPHLDELVREMLDIQFEYIDVDVDGEKKWIAPLNETDVNVFTLQATVLRYIYKKTGMVFAEHSGYLHNIIPTTLRGLAQLMALLSSMDDPTELDHLKDPAQKQIKQLKERVPCVLNNVRLFEDYFLNDWIPAKLSEEQRIKMAKITSAVPTELPHRIYHTILRIMDPEEKGIKRFPVKDNVDYWDAAAILDKYVSDYRNVEHYYFASAIRAYVTIQCNKVANEKMLRKLATFGEEANKLLFDFEDCTLLDCFYFPIDKSAGSAFYEYEGQPVVEIENGEIKYHALGVFPAMLKKGKDNGEHSSTHISAEEGKKEQWIISAQMTALCMMCNWDVQEKIYKEFKLQKEMEHQTEDETKSILGVVQSALNRINAGYDAEAPQGNRVFMLKENVADTYEPLFEEYRKLKQAEQDSSGEQGAKETMSGENDPAAGTDPAVGTDSVAGADPVEEN